MRIGDIIDRAEVKNPAVIPDKAHAFMPEGGTVALLGVEDLIVVRTGDAVLVARRGRGEDVREIVARLKAEGRSELL